MPPGGRVTRERTAEGDPEPPEVPAPPSSAPRGRLTSPRTLQTPRMPARGSEAGSDPGSVPGSDPGSGPSRGAARTGRPSAAAAGVAPVTVRAAWRFFAPLIFMTELNAISKSVIHAFLARLPARHDEPRRLQRRVHRLLRVLQRDRGLLPRDHLMAAGPPLHPPPAPLLLPHHRRAGECWPSWWRSPRPGTGSTAASSARARRRSGRRSSRPSSFA